MIIAISQKQEQNIHGDLTDTLEHNYLNYLKQWNITPVIIPNNLSNLQTYLKQFKIDRIILTGGNDIDPQSYNQPRPQNILLVPQRDQTETTIIKYAIQHNIPLLGICRGIQFINVYFKGKIINIKQTFGPNVHLPRHAHSLNITDEYTKKIIGSQTTVNSYHNYAINQQTISPQLRPFAQSPDELIEGFYHPTLPIAGILWHPERDSPDPEFNKKIINAFMNKELFWNQK